MKKEKKAKKTTKKSFISSSLVNNEVFSFLVLSAGFAVFSSVARYICDICVEEKLNLEERKES